MHAAKLTQVVRRVGATDSPTDRQLLGDFRGGDEAAFAEVVRRHGPMVLRVCRRALRHEQDAEDAFQATFLVLARKAGSVRRTEGLAAWLHGVAHRISLRAKRDAGRRRAHELAAPPATARTPDPDWRDVQAALDEEIRALPEACRGPFVLCVLEGKSCAEAAAELGLKEGTVWSRLSHARARLRARLYRPGIELPALLAVVALAADAAHARVVEATARRDFTARAGALARAANGTPTFRLGAAVLALVAAGVVAFGGQKPAAVPPAANPPPAAQAPPKDFDPEDPKFAGHFRGRVYGPDGKPLAGASVRVAAFHATDNTPGPVRATTDADGRFAFDAPDLTFTEYDGLPARREGYVVATKDGLAADWCHTWGHRTGMGLRSHWDPIKGAEVSLHLAKDDVPIRGRFLGPDGKPLAGVRVRATDVSIPRDRDLDKHLADQKTRAAYTMTSYERGADPARIPGATAVARTDADGRFTLTGLGRDRLVTLEVTGATVEDTTLHAMTRAAADAAVAADDDPKVKRAILGANFTHQLKAGLTVTGVVRDRDTKAPIPGMWVPRRYNPLTHPELTQDAAVTDENGRFKLTGYNLDLVNWDEKHRDIVAVPRPGSLHMTAIGVVGKDATAVVECVKGIPFRLKLLDERGKPAEGTVEYIPISPNPGIEDVVGPLGRYNWPVMSRAARKPDGTYEGFVLPGPAAVLVTMPDRRAYRPARVDPKAFFAPGRAWPADSFNQYGTHNTLASQGQWWNQADYSAIVLVNAAKGSAPLDLSATVYRDRPRRVNLTDPDGKPLTGATAHLYDARGPYDIDTHLRSASLLLTGLHPDRPQRVAFVKEDRKWIGFAAVAGDAETPLAVKLQPWGSVTLRLVDANGDLPKQGFGRGEGLMVRNDDPAGSAFYKGEYLGEGRFRVDGLVPGQSYHCRGVHRFNGAFSAAVFEKLVLKPGEVRDLGDIRVTEKGGK